jgi:general secretion pathway protein D
MHAVSRDGLVLFRRLFRLCAALVLAVALPVAAQDTDTVTLNFVNADIDAVVKAVGEITGRNFVVDPRVKGTVNIVSARPVAKSLVYPTLLSALRMQGFAAVESDGVVKIVPEADAKTQAGPVQRGAVTASGERIVTQVIALRYESAAQLVTVLRPLITPNNAIAAYVPGNAIIVTDYADNLKRIDRIVASLDQAPAGEPMLIPVKNASALDVVALVNRLLTETPGTPAAPADAQQRVALIADPRSNSILIRADNPARSARVRQLIEQLDTPARIGGNVFIVYLKNAEAAHVAETLRGLYGGERAQGAPATAGGASAMPIAAALPANAASAFPASPAATSPLATTNAASGTVAFAAGGAMVQADTTNNALIIMAPEPVYNNLRAVIERLDSRRAQVFVEALIVEVTSDKAAEFGIQWQVLSGLNRNRSGVQGFGGTNFGTRSSTNSSNIVDASVNLGSLGQGLNLGILNGTITIPGLGVISNLGLLIRALENDTTANILSTPTLLTLDNEEARIIVGQNVPFITGQYSTTGQTATVQPFQTIERRDVGLVLRVKPQITEGGTVRLGIYQEVSRVEDTSSAGPILSKRALESSVVIDDQQIVVLGGLIQDSMNDGTQKLPYAGDVPVFGSLFRYDTRARTKTNLMIFLKPTIVRGTTEGRTLTSERYDYLRGEQSEIAPPERWFWKDPTAPVLPPQGTMQGTPQAAPIGQPEPRNR